MGRNTKRSGIANFVSNYPNVCSGEVGICAAPLLFFEGMGNDCAYFIDIEEIYKPGFDRTKV
jgi:hypothetical protein